MQLIQTTHAQKLSRDELNNQIFQLTQEDWTDIYVQEKKENDWRRYEFFGRKLEVAE